MLAPGEFEKVKESSKCKGRVDKASRDGLKRLV